MLLVLPLAKDLIMIFFRKYLFNLVTSKNFAIFSTFSLYCALCLLLFFFWQDERELKRERRKQSNRESARRSRLRKQVFFFFFNFFFVKLRNLASLHIGCKQ